MFIKINEERFRISTIKRYKKQVVATGNNLLIWFTGDKMFTAFKFEDVSKLDAMIVYLDKTLQVK